MSESSNQDSLIAVLPKPHSTFVDAVRKGGGEVAALSDRTTGLIWLEYADSEGLATVLQQNPQLRWVQLPFAGVDAFAAVIDQFGDKVLFTSAKGAYAQPVAEHALALMLALLRLVHERARATTWDPISRGTSLFGLTVVIVGAGGIALELVRLLAPFRVRVIVVRRTAAPVAGVDRTVPVADLDGALREADVVVIAAAATDKTDQLIGAKQFELMKSSAVLVNIARGRLIDTVALIEALRSNAIAGAGIDVTDPEPLPDGHPLWDEPHVLITPHSADTPEMTAPLLAARITANVSAFLTGGTFIGSVDPEAGY